MATKQTASSAAPESEPSAPAPVEAQDAAPIRVKAIRTGFYGGSRRRPGDEFAVQTERELGTWMERLPE